MTNYNLKYNHICFQYAIINWKKKNKVIRFFHSPLCSHYQTAWVEYKGFVEYEYNNQAWHCQYTMFIQMLNRDETCQGCVNRLDKVPIIECKIIFLCKAFSSDWRLKACAVAECFQLLGFDESHRHCIPQYNCFFYTEQVHLESMYNDSILNLRAIEYKYWPWYFYTYGSCSFWRISRDKNVFTRKCIFNFSSTFQNFTFN